MGNYTKTKCPGRVSYEKGKIHKKNKSVTETCLSSLRGFREKVNPIGHFTTGSDSPCASAAGAKKR